MKTERKSQVALLGVGALLSSAVALTLDVFTGVGASTMLTSAYNWILGLDLLFIFSIVGGVVCVSFLLSFLGDALVGTEKDSVVC